MFQLDNLEMYKNPLLNFMEISANKEDSPLPPMSLYLFSLSDISELIGIKE